MTPLSNDKPGARIGKYQILCHLKTGGMGAVYRALDRDAGREVALKVLSPESANNPKKLERFRREAQHGALLQHENIVELYEFGELNGVYFLAMEFIEGIDLEEYVRKQGVFKPDAARHILYQIARALDFAHQIGVVHRDIKPSNIMLTQRHGRTIVKLADMGLARGGIDEESRVTSDGSTVGTVDYMSPEQARDSGSADVRSDIYSLGCTLYHMLAGAPPFAEGSLVERVVKHAKTEPADLRELNPDIPEDLWAVCRRMLAKKPSQRYQTPAELLADLPLVADIHPIATALAPGEPTSSAKNPTRVNSAGATTLEAATGPQPIRIAAAQLEHGRQAVASGNYDYGMMLLLNCSRLDPGSIEVRQSLRQAQLSRSSMSGLRPWRSWLTRWVFKGWLTAAKQLRSPLQVLRCGEELLTCDPYDVQTQLDMGNAARDAGYFDLAVWLLETAKTTHGDHIAVNRALALVLEAQGEFPRAIELWKHVAELDSEDRDARKKITDLLANQTSKKVYDERRQRGPTMVEKTAPVKKSDKRSLIT